MIAKAASLPLRWQAQPKCERLQRCSVQAAAQPSFCSSTATSLGVVETSLTSASLSPPDFIVSNLCTTSSPRKALRRDDKGEIEVGNSSSSLEAAGEAGEAGEGRGQRIQKIRRRRRSSSSSSSSSRWLGRGHDEYVLTTTTTAATGSTTKRLQRMAGLHQANLSSSQGTTTIAPTAPVGSDSRASRHSSARRQRLRDQRIARVKTLSGRPSPAIEADDVTQVGKSAGLLSHEEEIRLSDLYKRGCQLKSTKAQLTEKIGRKPSLAEWAEATGLSRSSLQKSLRDYQDAKQRIINSNVRLVYHVARKLNWGTRLSLEDLVQEGTIGLFKAVDKFDPARGYRFSTFAHWDIMSHIMRAKRDNRMVRLPAHIWSAVTKLNRTKAELKQGNAAPTPAQIAQKMGTTENKVLQLETWAKDVYELDRKAPGAKGSEGSPVLDLISAPDSDSFDPLEQMENGFLKVSMEDVLQTLPGNYGKVVRMRYGLDDSRPKTLAEIAKVLNISSERVRQIEARALGKLRQPERSRVLEDFVV